MIEITTISLERMNNGAHFMFLTNVTERAEADAHIKAKASALLTALRTALNKEDEALKLSQKSLLTDDIQKADNLRDSLFSGYKKGVGGYKNFPVEAIAKAAQILLQHLKDYNIDTTMQLDKETGLLINFISDLEVKYASQVEMLSLTAFVSSLKTANEQLRTLTLSRTEERTGQLVGIMKQNRKDSDTAYRNLVKMVNALTLVEGETNYVNFINYVNTEIVHYKREVIGQTAKPVTPGEDGGEVTPPEDPDENPDIL